MYYAFLICSLKFPIKFPRFLLWDCWASGELDEEKIKRICEVFQELSLETGEEFQMIFSTAVNAVADYVPGDNLLLRNQTADEDQFLFLEKGEITHSRRE